MSADTSWSQAALWLLVAVPAGTGAVLCLLGERGRRLAAPVSLVAASVTAALSVLVISQRPEVETVFAAGLPFGLGVDLLSAWMVGTVAVVALIVLLFAAVDIRRSPARFHGLMLLFVAAVLLTATASTLPSLLVGWEVMGAASFALIGFEWDEPGKTQAGVTAFVTTRAADLGLYVAAGAALAGGDGVALAHLVDADPWWRHVIVAGILVAALGKAAQLPFSFWLSRAMAGPAPVSALLHSAAMVAMGGYLLLRVSDLLAVTGWAMWAAAWTGAVTALVLGVVAFAQSDLKQLLAASTGAQMGFIVLAAGVGAVAGGTAQLVAHAATKAALFLLAGLWLSTAGTKQLVELRGIGRRQPAAGTLASLAALALAGVAPLSLWATKDDVLAVVRDRSLPLYVVATAAAWLSAAYAARILVVVWARPEAGQVGRAGPAGAARLVPIGMLATGAVLLGALALPPLGPRVREAFGESGQPTARPGDLVLSAVVALVLIVVVARWSVSLQRRTRFAHGWMGLEPAARWLVVRPTFAAARAAARFDDHVLTRVVDSTGRLARSVGIRASRFDLSVIDGLVRGSARTVRRAGDLARIPQTGQVYQYYAQTVLVLSVAVVALVVWGVLT